MVGNNLVRVAMVICYEIVSCGKWSYVLLGRVKSHRNLLFHECPGFRIGFEWETRRLQGIFQTGPICDQTRPPPLVVIDDICPNVTWMFDNEQKRTKTEPAILSHSNLNWILISAVTYYRMITLILDILLSYSYLHQELWGFLASYVWIGHHFFYKNP